MGKNLQTCIGIGITKTQLTLYQYQHELFQPAVLPSSSAGKLSQLVLSSYLSSLLLHYCKPDNANQQRKQSQYWSSPEMDKFSTPVEDSVVVTICYLMRKRITLE